MAFNWAGAASGAYEGLQDAIRMKMAEQEFAQRQQQLDEQQQWRRMQAEVNQQNAQSLADERKSRAAERESKQKNAEQLFNGARALLANPDSLDLSMHDPETAAKIKAFEIARAQHIVRYGQDLPDTAISSFYGAPKQATPKPEYQPMTPQERADFDWKERTRNKYDRTGSSAASTKPYADWNPKYGKDPELPFGPQRWLAGVVTTWSKSTKQDAYQRAKQQLMDEFDAQVASGNRYLSMAKVLAEFDRAWMNAQRATDPMDAIKRQAAASATSAVPPPPTR